jgi:CheY-like chemotaxis protein
MATRVRKVLIVDDNGVLRALLAQALEAAGYVAIAADSGESALEVVRFDPPDLCVVDQVMPGMSGADLVRTLRASEDEQLRRMPVIGLSGVSGAERLFLEAGADAALPKPFREGPLLEMVERTLAGR